MPKRLRVADRGVCLPDVEEGADPYAEDRVAVDGGWLYARAQAWLTLANFFAEADATAQAATTPDDLEARYRLAAGLAYAPA